MNTEMLIVGIILFSGMIGGGISLYIKRRKERQDNLNTGNNSASLSE